MSLGPRVSSESRESSRASSVAGSSSFSRAAASSSASGSPSSRRQISSTSARRPGVARARPRARSRNSSTAAACGRGSSGYSRLHRDVQRDAARRRAASARASGAGTARPPVAASRTCSKLSSTSSARWCSALSDSERPSACSVAGRTASGSRQRRQRDEVRAVRELVRELGRQLQGEPGLAGAAGARDRDEPLARAAAPRRRAARSHGRRAGARPRAGSTCSGCATAGTRRRRAGRSAPAASGP